MAVERSAKKEAEEAPAVPGKKPDTAKLKADLDSLLDEIDDVLVENADTFVKAYVQIKRITQVSNG